MSIILVATTSHNNLSTRGELSLTRMIDSVRAARTQLEHQRGGRLVWSWVDDGSSDGTAEWLTARLRPDDGELLTVNQTNSYATLARNQAVARLRSDLVNIFDSDDEMLPNHLVTGCDALRARDAAGQSFGCASTLTGFGDSGELHPEWIKRISVVNVNTTFYRRCVWEFVEGMPPPHVYRVVGCEDQDLLGIVQAFFPIGLFEVVTARYWRYDGNAFDRQLKKFQRDPDGPDGIDRTPAAAGHRQLHDARESWVMHHIQYLKTKLCHVTDRRAFEGIRTGPAFAELGLY
jgi:glycosyltransferase involved in cell wall biosynthesis